MPPVIAAAAAALTSFLISAGVAASFTVLGITVTTFEVVETVLYVGLVFGLAALLPKPPHIRTQTPLKQSTPPRRYGWGRVRISGPYMLYEAYGHEAIDIIALIETNGIPVTQFGRLWLNDDECKWALADDGHEYHVISPDGHKYGRNGHQVYFDFRYGLATETAYSYVLNTSNFPASAWPPTSRGDGIASMAFRYVQAGEKVQQQVFPNGTPLPSFEVSLTATYDPRLQGLTSLGSPSAWSFNRNPACALIDYLTSANSCCLGLPFAQYIAPTIADYVTAANICDEPVQTALNQTYLQQAQSSGRDTLVVNSVQGMTDGLVLSVGYGGADVESATIAGISGNVVTLTANLAFDHLQGEEVTWNANGSAFVNRYTIDGIYEADRDPAEVISDILACMDGWLGQRGDGALRLYAGQYYAPTVTFTDDHVLAYSVQHFTPDEEACNQLLPSYVDPNFSYNEVDAGEWDDVADQAARGRVRSKKLQLLWASSRSQCRRLAKRVMSRYSQELRGTFTTNLYGMNGLGERYVLLQLTDNQALVSLPVEVLKVDIDLANLTLTYHWVAADPNIDEWSLQEETGNGGLVNSSASTTRVLSNQAYGAAPTITAAAIVNNPVNGAGTGSQLQLTVTSPETDAQTWVVQTSPHGLNQWTTTTIDNAAPGATVTLMTPFVPQGGSVDVQVAYENAGGQGDYSSIFTVSVPTTAPTVGTSGTSSSTGLVTCSENLAAGAIVSAGPGGWRNANATDATRQADGFVLAAFTAGQTPTVYLAGQVISGLSGLTEGATYFLATSAGAITTTAPSATGNWVQELGRAIDATHLLFQPKTGTTL